MLKINYEKCTGCGGCQELCPEIAIDLVDDKSKIIEEKCTECKICLKVCPVQAVVEE